MKVTLVSFANAPWAVALDRLVRQAKELDFFDNIYAVDEKTLAADTAFIEENKNFINSGIYSFGAYTWKTYILESAFKKFPDSDFFMYLDSGSEFNVKPSTEKRFKQYFSIADGQDLFAWTTRDKEENLTHCSVIDRIYPAARGRKQFEGGTLIFKNTQWSLDLVMQWRHESRRDNYYNIDPKHSEPCCKYFGAHLSDQSVLSCILKKEGVIGIPDEASWYLPSYSVFSNVKRNRDTYPLFSARNMTGKSIIDKDCIAYKEHVVCVHGLGHMCSELVRVR